MSRSFTYRLEGDIKRYMNGQPDKEEAAISREDFGHLWVESYQIWLNLLIYSVLWISRILLESYLNPT